MDNIILRRIPLNLRVGTDAWNRDKPQPVFVSLEISYDVQEAAANDDVSRTLDYGKLYKSLTGNLGGDFISVAHLAVGVRKIIATKYCLMEIVMPKANLRAEGGMHFTFDFKEGELPGSLYLSQSLSIKGIRCACIVGVNQHEREEKQIVVVNLDFKTIENADDEEALNKLLLSSFTRETKARRDIVQGVVKVRTP
jgi:FolB domain-containing protein